MRFSPHRVLGWARGAAAQTLVLYGGAEGARLLLSQAEHGQPLRTVAQRNPRSWNAQKCCTLNYMGFLRQRMNQNQPKTQ